MIGDDCVQPSPPETYKDLTLLFGVQCEATPSVCPVWTDQHQLCRQSSHGKYVYCVTHLSRLLGPEIPLDRMWWSNTNRSGICNHVPGLPLLFQYHPPVTRDGEMTAPVIGDWEVFQMSALHTERGLQLLHGSVKPWRPSSDDQWLIIRLVDFITDTSYNAQKGLGTGGLATRTPE